MEELILDGVVKGVIDFSPHEITDLLYGGLMPAMPGRLEAAGRMGLHATLWAAGALQILVALSPLAVSEVRTLPSRAIDQVRTAPPGSIQDPTRRA